MKKYIIVDDSGIDYNFIRAFDYNVTQFLGAIVNGTDNPNEYGCLTVEKPHGLTGWYTADKRCFAEVDEEQIGILANIDQHYRRQRLENKKYLFGIIPIEKLSTYNYCLKIFLKLHKNVELISNGINEYKLMW